MCPESGHCNDSGFFFYLKSIFICKNVFGRGFEHFISLVNTTFKSKQVFAAIDWHKSAAFEFVKNRKKFTSKRILSYFIFLHIHLKSMKV